MKKKFILFCGVSWSGTTSLYYTLKNNVKYIHGGWVKESVSLAKVFPEIVSTRMPVIKKYSHDVLLRSLEYINNQEDVKNDPPLLKFTEKELNSYFGPNINLERYVDHYVNLAEYCGEDYQAVGDFSNKNFNLEKNMLDLIRLELIKHFDIKVMFILRDPIRKKWSEICALTNGRHFSPTYEINSNMYENFMRTEFNPTYAKKIKDTYEVFGKENVCYLIMEDFFKDEKNNPEVSKLEKFLDIKIPDVHPCAFVPDRGINAPLIDNLKDQSLSDHEILTEEFYNLARKRDDYMQIYSEFEELHGYLPADWGRPINYGY